MSRQVEGTHELDDGREVAAVLHYIVEPYRPATHMEPAEGGLYVDALEVDGVIVDHSAREFEDTADRLLQQARDVESDWPDEIMGVSRGDY